MKTWFLNQKTSFVLLRVSDRIPKKRIMRWVSVVLVFAILNLTIGCRYYFIAKSSPLPSSEKIASVVDDSTKRIIVHFNEKKWLLADIQLRNNVLTGKLYEYKYFPTIKPVKPNKANRYLYRPSLDQRYLLNEVHLYLDGFADMGNNEVSIPVKSISKIEIYDPDTAATVGSWVLGILGPPLFLIVLTLLAFLLKESCPFIYTWDGENYQFAGEIYSGSIHKPLERNDYLKLPTYPGQQSYKLKITNEVKEIQHTNLLELLVIDHPVNTDVLVDKYGKITTMGQPVAPVKASNLAGEEITKLISSKDNLFYQSNSKDKDLPLKDGVILTFPNQANSKSAKLAIHAKNSIVLDYMLGQFHKMFGSAYQGYAKKQEKSSGDEMRKWSLDQGIPLSLYVERDGKWDFVDYYNIAGPMKFKEDVLSIPLNGKETNPLKVKLEFGNFLWEIDYAAVDYSGDQKVTSYTIPAKTAINEEQKDVVGLLNKDDGKYYTQPTMDNMAEVTFDLPASTDTSRTVILHSKGWYEILLNPVGKPDINKLKSFKQPGQFNRFVNEQLKKMEQQISQAQ